MIPDVEERLHIERYIGSNLIVKSQQHGYAAKQQPQPQPQTYKQFQNARYSKFVTDNNSVNSKNGPESRPPPPSSSPVEHTPVNNQRYPFSPKTTTAATTVVGTYGRNTDSRTNCWSGYPLISFSSGRRDSQNSVEQPRHYYASNVGNNLKNYAATNAKTSKCSYSDFVTNKQGLPLIQANGKFQDRAASNWERENRNFQSKNGQNEASNLPYCAGFRTPIHEGRGENHAKSECGGVDENYANSENCLPRIIKPRKRRKKDRKPSTAGFTSPSNATPQTAKKLQEKSDKPVSYKIHSHAATAEKQPDSSQILHNLHLTLYRPKSKPLALYQEGGGSVSDLLISRSLVNLFSEDSPQLVLNDELRFENLLGKDTSSDSSQSATTTTFCNCRYCDPEGVVWDIRQRCFSPNLMPPAEGANKNIVAGKLAKNKDWSTTLKRSCSEPASKPSSTPVISRVRALSDSYDTTNQNLQVSSEIVTSLNGHRDIEIKFFSSSTPTSKI